MLTAITGMVAVSMVVVGVSATVIVNVMYLIRVRRAFPEDYRTPSMVWKDAGAIKKKIDESGDTELARLYVLSSKVPAGLILIFGGFILLIILFSR